MYVYIYRYTLSPLPGMINSNWQTNVHYVCGFVEPHQEKRQSQNMFLGLIRESRVPSHLPPMLPRENDSTPPTCLACCLPLSVQPFQTIWRQSFSQVLKWKQMVPSRIGLIAGWHWHQSRMFTIPGTSAWISSWNWSISPGPLGTWGLRRTGRVGDTDIL